MQKLWLQTRRWLSQSNITPTTQWGWILNSGLADLKTTFPFHQLGEVSEIFYASNLRPILGGFHGGSPINSEMDFTDRPSLPLDLPPPRGPQPWSYPPAVFFHFNPSFRQYFIKTHLLRQPPVLLDFNGTHAETQHSGIASHHLSLLTKAFWPNLGRRLLWDK